MLVHEINTSCYQAEAIFHDLANFSNTDFISGLFLRQQIG